MADAKGPAGKNAQWLPSRDVLQWQHVPGHAPGQVTHLPLSLSSAELTPMYAHGMCSMEDLSFCLSTRYTEYCCVCSCRTCLTAGACPPQVALIHKPSQSLITADTIAHMAAEVGGAPKPSLPPSSESLCPYNCCPAVSSFNLAASMEVDSFQSMMFEACCCVLSHACVTTMLAIYRPWGKFQCPYPTTTV